ncbi:hypothetical protein XU18_0663 [Perkinsela sp. CCAP 1560/4]|nr:hypothetical protein XU18_0663 [Perkinsela sp. CCAP 1560/4]|eukprot:KNH08985.1 hypothetical protein XU18_0663 [Perkinsela sp. CCAP 1560/4]
MKLEIKTIGAKLLSPLNALQGLIYRRAVNSTQCLPKEIQTTVEEYQFNGKDFTADLSRKYWSLQTMLFYERVGKLKRELFAILTSRPSEYNYKHVILFLRWMLRCLFLFIVGMIVGRQSIHPLVLPSSPFAFELKKQYDI